MSTETNIKATAAKALTVISSAALLASCAGGNNCHISGTADGAAEGDSVFLIDGTSHLNLDTTTISGGQFTFNYQADTTKYAIIRCNVAADSSSCSGSVFLEAGDINVTLAKKAGDSRAKGTPTNNISAALSDSINSIISEITAIEEQAGDTTLSETDRKALSAKADSLYDNSYVAFFKKSAAENIGNAAGLRILNQIAYALELNELDSLLQQVPALYHNDGTYTKLTDRVEHMKAVAVGQPFTDFSLPSPEGEMVNLGDIVKANKVVLIDFWASWCGPCRREMPTIVRAYELYKDKGLEIVGVSQDYTAEAWTNGINTLGITWPQMSALKGWDNEGVKLYAISSIPSTVIIKDGVIVANKLYGDELINKLDELLK